jgi:undecaprenyl-diphosphatase
LLDGGLTDATLVPLGVGLLMSALAGLAAIAFLLAFLRRRSTALFIGYRIMLAALIVLVVLAR